MAPTDPRSAEFATSWRCRGFQRLLFCPCGRALESRRALCRGCAQRKSYSRRRFGGHRETVLERDGHRCQSCGAGKGLQVHHRRPGLHDPDWLITLCAGCHARVHRLEALRCWLPEQEIRFWEEWHPAAPRQWQFELEEPAV